MQPAIRTEKLSKTYDKSVKALLPMDLTVPRGEVFGLLGPNGAGKTTLVKLLLGLVSPSSGKAWMNGIPVSTPLARKASGYLPENHRFPKFLTADQVLRYYGGMSGIEDQLIRGRIPDLLARVRLEKWRHVRIAKFSKGMLQRLGIAQAIIADPEILFLDEPTDGVDPIGRSEIRELIRELNREGKTIFLNSHLLSEVEQICTRVAILNEGHVVGISSVSDLTVSENVYVFETSSLPVRVQETLSNNLTILHDLDNRTIWNLSCADIASLNETIDTLRQSGVSIISVIPAQTTLEQRFIEMVKNDQGRKV